MTTTPEYHPNWHTLQPEDAFFMGRLAVAGLALPNSAGLSRPSHEVANVGDSVVQHEIDRLVTVADALARIPGVNFSGLAHAQLAPSAAAPEPLQLILAPALPPHAKSAGPLELQTRTHRFQCFVNTRLTLPTPPAEPEVAKTKEGCFSSGPVVAITGRPAVIEAVHALDRDGGPILAHEVDGFGAIILQHEVDHGAGRRAADRIGTRNWVSRANLDGYRAFPIEQAASWPWSCTPEQWQALSRDPQYAYFPTPQLQEAFAAGQEAQRQAAQY